MAPVAPTPVEYSPLEEEYRREAVIGHFNAAFDKYLYRADYSEETGISARREIVDIINVFVGPHYGTRLIKRPGGIKAGYGTLDLTERGEDGDTIIRPGQLGILWIKLSEIKKYASHEELSTDNQPDNSEIESMLVGLSQKLTKGEINQEEYTSATRSLVVDYADTAWVEEFRKIDESEEKALAKVFLGVGRESGGHRVDEEWMWGLWGELNQVPLEEVPEEIKQRLEEEINRLIVI